jgi:hypothetical protein
VRDLLLFAKHLFVAANTPNLHVAVHNARLRERAWRADVQNFNEVSALTHAFKRWTGRRRARCGQPLAFENSIPSSI